MARVREISEGGGLDGSGAGEPDREEHPGDQASQGGQCKLAAPGAGTPFRTRGGGWHAHLGDAAEGLEGETKVARGLEALFRVLLQAMAGDTLQAGRNRAAGSAELQRLVLENGVHQLHGGISGERVLAGEHLVQDDAEGEDVGAMVGGLAADLLGGHVAGRAENDSRLGVGENGVPGGDGRNGDELGQAEIQDLDMAVAGQEDVRGLEVAMDHALVVGGGQAAGDLNGVVDGLPGSQRAGVEPLAQRFALEQFDHDERRALVGPEIVDRDQIRVVQHPRRPGLLLEAPEAVRVAGKGGREHLDGNVAAEPGIARAVNLSHAARADQRADLVRPQLRSNGQSRVQRGIIA